MISEIETFSGEIASGIIVSSALVALPTIMIAAFVYSRWSSKRTLIGTVLFTLAGLAGALLPEPTLAWPPLLIAVIALLDFPITMFMPEIGRK